MSDFSLVSSESVPLTPEVALQHRDMEPSPTERILDPKRVKHLRGKILDGKFVCPSWSVAVHNGKKIRMNGQHSSHALCETNGEFPDGLSVHIDAYKVHDSLGLASLFRQFDDKRSSRSGLDISGAYQGLYPALVDVLREYAKLAAEGISWFERCITGNAGFAKGDDVGELYSEAHYHGFVQWIGERLSLKTPEMKKQEIVAAMWTTFDNSESKAREFWLDVASGAESSPGSPACVLSHTLRAVKEEDSKKRRLRPMQLYSICIHGWNAFVGGKDDIGRNFTHGIKKDSPEVLLF